MRKLIGFFAGLLLLVIAFGAMAVSGAIFDTSRQIRIESYFFQPNNLSSQRLGVPQTIAELGEAKMRQLLVQRYISEYFYIIPDAKDVEERMKRDSPLDMMSTAKVFNDWRAGEGLEIQKLAGDKAFRVARVIGDIFKPKGSDYWTVICELVTWPRSNDMAQIPVITRLELHIGIEDTYIMDFRENMNIASWLDEGREPAAIFRFGVTYIDIDTKQRIGA